MKLAMKGIDPDEIAKAMAEASPGLMDRKAGHEADYIERTIKKVMALPPFPEEKSFQFCLLGETTKLGVFSS